MYSCSISDCTAYNAAHCDAGNGTPQDGFSLRFLPVKSGGGVAGWRPTLHMNLKALAFNKNSFLLFRPKKLPSRPGR